MYEKLSRTKKHFNKSIRIYINLCNNLQFIIKIGNFHLIKYRIISCTTDVNDKIPFQIFQIVSN
jgi:hypothetical protein